MTYLFGQREEVEVRLFQFANPALEGGLSAPRSGRFILGNDPVPPAEKGGWASGPIWRVRKFSPGLDSRNAPPVTSCYTDYANPDS
jgi:hypothetical protein